MEALSRACQDYATGLLEDLVRIARGRGNDDVRHLIREGATLGAGEPMVVKFLQPYKMPWAGGALAEDEQQQQQQMQQQQQLQQQGQTRGLRAEKPHVLTRADVVRYLARKQRKGRGRGGQGHDRLIDLLATTSVKRVDLVLGRGERGGGGGRGGRGGDGRG